MSVTVQKNDEEEQKKNIDEQRVGSLRMNVVKHFITNYNNQMFELHSEINRRYL